VPQQRRKRAPNDPLAGNDCGLDSPAFVARQPVLAQAGFSAL
jgi:hypothetical protein